MAAPVRLGRREDNGAPAVLSSARPPTPFATCPSLTLPSDFQSLKHAGASTFSPGLKRGRQDLAFFFPSPGHSQSVLVYRSFPLTSSKERKEAASLLSGEAFL